VVVTEWTVAIEDSGADGASVASPIVPLALLPDDELPPIPPVDLIYRVVPAFGPADTDAARHTFDVAARSSVRYLELALAAVDRELTDFDRILDFGCGPGRIMRHLGPLAEHSELHGVDIDVEMVDWCAEHIPFATFLAGPHEPPLPYADGSFDLIFNHSVFTHIDEDRQDLWLAELQRILAPGGLALLTIHSTRQWNAALGQIEASGDDPGPYRAGLEGHGILFIADDAFIGSSHPSWYHSTFHAAWYIEEHWSRYFVIRAHIHEGADTQDMIVLERTAEPDPLLTPIGHLAPSPGVDSPPPPSAPGRSPLPLNRTTRRLLDRVRALRWLAARRYGADPHSSTMVSDRLDTISDKLKHLSNTRSADMMRYSLYQQGERIGIIERELREELAALRARLDDSSGG
jgi:SAM-dependent methyltransferase